MLSALRVVEGAIMTVSGVLGVEVGTERLWRRCDELGHLTAGAGEPARSRARRLLRGARAAARAAQRQVRGGRDPDRHRAATSTAWSTWCTWSPTCTARTPPATTSRCRSPRTCSQLADEYHDKLMDVVAETSDELMERYLEGGEITREEMAHGAEAAGHRGPGVPGRLRRRHPQHRLARAARPDRGGSALAGPRPQRARDRRRQARWPTSSRRSPTPTAAAST